MDKTGHMRVICAISLIGVLFSGYFSYSELFLGICPVGGCPAIFNVPVCVFGFVMFLMLS